ncbi:hypothetical protein CCR87_07320 [Rhodobaculum claviforme]|uniref:Uncharacterized protein n=1 Tax=Rhodobaculum claviforme TaxID=1549854 RepID=A0A934WGX7_9RHOB|nr:hypothetical protein [Rhodobaculum claviforme]
MWICEMRVSSCRHASHGIASPGRPRASQSTPIAPRQPARSRWRPRGSDRVTVRTSACPATGWRRVSMSFSVSGSGRIGTVAAIGAAGRRTPAFRPRA